LWAENLVVGPTNAEWEDTWQKQCQLGPGYESKGAPTLLKAREEEREKKERGGDEQNKAAKRKRNTKVEI